MDKIETFTVAVDPIDLDKIAESGQVFRWHKLRPHEYGIICGKAYCVARQVSKNQIEIDTTEQEMRNVWHCYFDLDTDYTKIIASIRTDDCFLQHCANVAYGVRVLRQDFWEMLVTFTISQNNNIPRIKRVVENLCAAFGERIITPRQGVVYAFPAAADLTNIGALQGMGLGYRDKYIVQLAANVACGEIDIEYIRSASYGDAFTSLCSIYGIGPKVANCVALFGAGKTGAFPADTWINKVVGKYYDGKFPVEQYQDTAGIMQQFMFYAAQHGEVHL